MDSWTVCFGVVLVTDKHDASVPEDDKDIMEVT